MTHRWWVWGISQHQFHSQDEILNHDKYSQIVRQRNHATMKTVSLELTPPARTSIISHPEKPFARTQRVTMLVVFAALYLVLSWSDKSFKWLKPLINIELKIGYWERPCQQITNVIVTVYGVGHTFSLPKQSNLETFTIQRCRCTLSTSSEKREVQNCVELVFGLGDLVCYVLVSVLSYCFGFCSPERAACK